MEGDLEELLSTLRRNTITSPRVIVYCPTRKEVAELYAHFHFELGECAYHPPGAPHLCENRIFGMFHSVALGMGVNLKDIIHYGAPSSIEAYFQESGRGGRSGDSATSTVYWKPADCPKSKNPVTIRERKVLAVRRYLENSTLFGFLIILTSS